MLIVPLLKLVLEVGTEPLQGADPVPPDAVQEVALLVVHESVVDWPVCNALGDAVKVRTAAGGAVAVTRTLAVLGKLWPPGPVQVREYSATPMVLTGPIEVPELCAGCAPLQPSPGVPPEAVHEVALEVDQVAVTVPPCWTVDGVTVKDWITGAGGTESTSTVTEVG